MEYENEENLDLDDTYEDEFESEESEDDNNSDSGKLYRKPILNWEGEEIGYMILTEDGCCIEEHYHGE